MLLPAELQCDPGASGNAALSSQLQRLPDSLTAALQCWGSDTQLQVCICSEGGGGTSAPNGLSCPRQSVVWYTCQSAAASLGAVSKLGVWQ